MKRDHFKRARAMFAAIAAAMLLPMAEQAAAMADIGPYRSRGKGRGSAPRNHLPRANKYLPHQGARECARRVRHG